MSSSFLVNTSKSLKAAYAVQMTPLYGQCYHVAKELAYKSSLIQKPPGYEPYNPVGIGLIALNAFKKLSDCFFTPSLKEGLKNYLIHEIGTLSLLAIYKVTQLDRRSMDFSHAVLRGFRRQYPTSLIGKCICTEPSNFNAQVEIGRAHV